MRFLLTSRLSEVLRSRIWGFFAGKSQIIAVSWGACKATDRRDSFATLFIQFIFRVKLSRFIFSFPFYSCSKIATNVADIRTSEIYNEVNKLKKLGERRATKRAVYPLLVPPSEARVQRGRGLKVRRSRTHNNNLFLSNLILFLAFYYDGS